ncbi:MAG: PaeR7I family type II restriction endonuclease [Phycisphaerales bacterium JB052]
MPSKSILSPDELNKRVSSAVKHFWITKTSQGKKQGKKTGVKDRGSRSEVTGGKHLDGFVQLFADIAIEAGMKSDSIYTKNKEVVLPGFFRAAKQWDLLVIVDERVVAVLELKSQVGSLGNNANNRAEEAVGNAHDFWTAYRNEQFKDSRKPWIGYMFLLEDSDASIKPVSVVETHYQVLPIFKSASYMDRYALCCKQMVRERLYDSAALIASKKESGKRGVYRVPDPSIDLSQLCASFYAHLVAQKQAGLF